LFYGEIEMASFLMWQFKNRNEGVFHAANSAAERTKMLGKGYVDITGQQVWTVPYPISKTTKQPVVNVPAQVVPESPVVTIPAVEETPAVEAAAE
jgi:hypothetical protein